MCFDKLFFRPGKYQESLNRTFDRRVFPLVASATVHFWLVRKGLLQIFFYCFVPFLILSQYFTFRSVLLVFSCDLFWFLVTFLVTRYLLSHVITPSTLRTTFLPLACYSFHCLQPCGQLSCYSLPESFQCLQPCGQLSCHSLVTPFTSFNPAVSFLATHCLSPFSAFNPAVNFLVTRCLRPFTVL